MGVRDLVRFFDSPGTSQPQTGLSSTSLLSKPGSARSKSSRTSTVSAPQRSPSPMDDKQATNLNLQIQASQPVIPKRHPLLKDLSYPTPIHHTEPLPRGHEEISLEAASSPPIQILDSRISPVVHSEQFTRRTLEDHTSISDAATPSNEFSHATQSCSYDDESTLGSASIDGLPSVISMTGPFESAFQSSTSSATRNPQPPSSSENHFKKLSINHIENKSGLTPQTRRFVPSSDVFSPGSAPLHLPKLDQYLSTIPEPHFTASGIFPGLEELQKTPLSSFETIVFTPSWKRGLGANVLDSAVSVVLGTLGSSVVSAFYNLQGMYQAIQMFTVILGSVDPNIKQSTSSMRRLLLYTLPNLLALNLSSALGFPLLFLTGFFILGIALEYIFWRVTRGFVHSDGKVVKGLSVESWKRWGNGKKASLMALSFAITVLYLPLSTLALQALVWSSDFWPSPDSLMPTQNCYTTSIVPGSINLAWIVVPMSVVLLSVVTVYHPIRLAQTIRVCLPRVDEYTELGRPRNATDKQHEYQRVLTRDKNPFAFLYQSYRQEWGTYQSLYLFAKLVPLLLATIFTNTNCLFLSQPERTLAIIRESLLITAMLGFLLLQTFAAPFVDPVSNASEWVSRLSYVLTAGVGLIVALDSSEESIWNGPVLYTLEALYYSMDLYFIVIDLSFVHRLVKRMTRRVDFSIDIFSPSLDLSSSSAHLKRRIWQETLSAVLVTSPEFRMPLTQKLVFAESPLPDTSHWPPVLLDFTGSVAERHVEDLKILREVGSVEFKRAATLLFVEHCYEYKSLREAIMAKFLGPDSYWCPQGSVHEPTCWGNTWMTPFPFTLVIRYDNGHYATVSALNELRAYVEQNDSRPIVRRRCVRQALRSLDGAVVRWPHVVTKSVGSRWFSARHYQAQMTTYYEVCTLRIAHHGDLLYEGIQLSSGFAPSLAYSKDVVLSGSHIGITDDFTLTMTLAHFLTVNTDIVRNRLPLFTASLDGYRRSLQLQMRRKDDTLSYEFMALVYEEGMASPSEVKKVVEMYERNPSVRQMPTHRHDAMHGAHERMRVVTRSSAAAWWYLFWDDFWRRNHATIHQLQTHKSSFNPQWATSIAYRPLPRAALEGFLSQRGLFDARARKDGFLNVGLLNKLYVYMNQLVFRGTEEAIQVYLDLHSTVSTLDVEKAALIKSSPILASALTISTDLGTGGGTSHDDSSIRTRPAYRWEGMWYNPRRSPWTDKLAIWFGLTNLQRREKAAAVDLGVQLTGGKWHNAA